MNLLVLQPLQVLRHKVLPEIEGRGHVQVWVGLDLQRHSLNLVRNHEDVVEVYASHLRDGYPCRWMDPVDFGQRRGQNVQYSDQVLKDGKPVGVSSRRQHSHHFRAMLPLCSIEIDQAELGNEVVVLWGEPGSRQKESRATVARFPYLNEGRNESVDVGIIPCRAPRGRDGVENKERT